MKKFIFAIALSLSIYAQAQNTKADFGVGFSYGRIDNLSLVSTPIVYSHQVAQVAGLRYIVGLRQNLAFGAKTFEVNKQQTLIDDLSTYSINLMAGLEYVSKYKLTAGFNIDLLGGTIGTRSYKTVGKDPVYAIKTQDVNLLKGGESDEGSLNSEFYIGYKFNSKSQVKVGIVHYGMGLLYSNKSIAETKTLEFVTMPFIAFQYTLWEKNP